MLSLSELAKIHKKKQRAKTKTYETILEKCHTQIRNMARRDQTFCYYIVPLYVMGLPLYDINACIVHILLHLKKKGFYVQMTNPHTIYISWKHINERSHQHRQSHNHQPRIEHNQRSQQQNSNWSQRNQRYLPQRQAITYRQPTQSSQMGRFIERSRSLL
jgi:hypothetical protein